MFQLIEEFLRRSEAQRRYRDQYDQQGNHAAAGAHAARSSAYLDAAREVAEGFGVPESIYQGLVEKYADKDG